MNYDEREKLLKRVEEGAENKTFRVKQHRRMGIYLWCMGRLCFKE